MEVLYKTEVRSYGVIVKGSVACALLLLSVWYISLAIPDLEFECVEGELSLCWFKRAVALFAFFVLLPYLFESWNVGAMLLLCIDKRQSAFVVADKRGRVIGLDMDGTLYFNGPVARIYGDVLFQLLLLPARLLAALVLVPIAVLSGRSWTHNTGVLELLILMDLLHTFLLPPLAVIVVLSSGSPTDILINFAAVSIFAQIDDILVRLVVTRKSNVHLAIGSFFVGLPERYSLDSHLVSPDTVPRVLVAYGIVSDAADHIA